MSIRDFRRTTELRDPQSFDHVGRDIGARGLTTGRVLAEIADHDDRVVCATADIQFVTHLAEFRLKHPERMFQFGISELNMIGAAAGMAACGFIPYISTFASFTALLGYESIKFDIAHPNLPVRILGTHAGISQGFYGPSHHATEDIAALRALANVMILSPCDGLSTEALLWSTWEHSGPIYFRLGRGREDDVYSSVPQGYGPGEPAVLCEGSDLLIIATGTTVDASLKSLRNHPADIELLSATVLDVHTLKPFASDTIRQLARRHRAILIVEEHNVEGGLGSMVLEVLAEHGIATPLYKHGLYDEFGIIGPPLHLYEYYGLDPKGIAIVSHRLLEAVAAGGLPQQRSLWTRLDKQAVLERRGAMRELPGLIP